MEASNFQMFCFILGGNSFSMIWSGQSDKSQNWEQALQALKMYVQSADYEELLLNAFSIPMVGLPNGNLPKNQQIDIEG